MAGALFVASSLALAQRDSGVRGNIGFGPGLANTGGGLQAQGIPIPHPPLISPNPTHLGDPNFAINPQEVQAFIEGIRRAGQLESTCDSCSKPPTGVGDGNDAGPPLLPAGSELDPQFPQHFTNSNGLGAVHNGDSCFICHSQPTLGGAGGFISLGKGRPAQNPQFDLVPHRFGKLNTVPPFEEQFGPIREVRFRFNPDGTRDGSVHNLWTVRGINNDPTIGDCRVTQPDFAHEARQDNVAFRIPLQILGLGLIESIPDTQIFGPNSHAAEVAELARSLGISGHPNRSDNDQTISRFGWKAQNKSIAIFAGEAYNVEIGVSNDVFPQFRNEDPDCNGPDKPEPNDVPRFDSNGANNHDFFNPNQIMPDWLQFTILMRLTDGPDPDPNPSTSAQAGRIKFNEIGCAVCHTPTMTTGNAGGDPVLSDRPVNLFSDLLVHHVGARLADNVVQAQAGPDEFRTTPLWGIGNRIFFLHDGRTNNLLRAIEDHFSESTPANGNNPEYPASEANAVIQNFNQLSVAEKQSILDFLRSL